MADLLDVARELEEIKFALQDNMPPIAPGVKPSPAYVRGLRDRAAVAALNGLCANMDGARALKHQEESGDLCDVTGVTAREFANALVKALGYEPPGEEGP